MCVSKGTSACLIRPRLMFRDGSLVVARVNVLVEVDSTVRELAECSSLLDLGSLLGVLQHCQLVNFVPMPVVATARRLAIQKHRHH